jgi:long-chain acyl-CoA synthetase
VAKKEPYPWLKKYPKDIDWHTDIPLKPLHAIMEHARQTYPDRPALHFMGKTYTFRQVYKRVRRMACGLQQMGVKKDTKVGLFLPNCPQFIIAYFAVLRIGGVVVNYNPLYSSHELEHQINDSGTEIMITLGMKALYPKLPQFLHKTSLRKIIVSDLPEVLPFPKNMLFAKAKKREIAHWPRDNDHVSFQSLLAKRGIPEAVEIDPVKDLAVLQYTGGTTGVPKGTMLTHANLYANTVQTGHWFTGLNEGHERVLGVLPLFHVFAMTVVMNISLLKGCEITLHPRFDLHGVIKDIEARQITLFPGVPTIYAAIINYKKLTNFDLSSLKVCFSGGAPLPHEVKTQFENLTGCKLIEGYGLSESSPVASANPLFGENKTGSIGIPIPGTVIEICDVDDEDNILPQGEQGEICLSGPQIMAGYWKNKKESDSVLRNGRLHTGDVGYIDEDGYTFIVDRLKEMIITGGYNVYPRNIEEVLYTHESIVEAAVLGIEHPKRGQMIKAYVVKKEGSSLTEAAVRSYLKDRVAGYAVPHKVEFRNELPKSMIGKILKKELLSEEMSKLKS